MTFDEFLKDDLERRALFIRWWRMKHEETPDHFPMDLSSGEWDEQLWSFDPAEALEELEAAGLSGEFPTPGS